MTQELNQYINKRYIYWLDYATFHSSLCRFPDLARDVLHTVLLNLLEKPEEQVLSLYQKVKKPYRELDYFILRMIKINCHSKTSPFRYYFFERVPIDANTDPLQMTWIADQVYDPDEDVFANNFISDLRLLRLAIDRTDLSPFEKGIINWKLLGNENIKNYPYATESPGGLYGNFAKGRQKVTETFRKLKYNE